MIVKSKVPINRTKKDFTVQYFVCSGNGGQNRQKNATGVRIIDNITELRSECQDERSRLQNLKKAFMSLANKIIKFENKKNKPEKILLTNRVRTYDITSNSITDARIPHKKFRPADILSGNLDIILKEIA